MSATQARRSTKKKPAGKKASSLALTKKAPAASQHSTEPSVSVLSFPQRQQSPEPHVAMNSTLLMLVEHLPSDARRLIVLGKPKDETNTSLQRRLYAYVKTLIEHGWTDQQILAFFESDLPLTAVAVFQRKYGNEAKGGETLHAMLTKARKRKNPSSHVLPRLLDPEWCLGARIRIPAPFQQQSYLRTKRTALHQIATFAQHLYNREQPGHYLAALPMGIGKTWDCLLPFVVHIGKQYSSKGIVIAVERIEQVKEYTAWVNDQVGDPVAFPLMGHDLESCQLAKEGKPYNRKKCLPYHKDYAADAYQYPIVFMTHSMLSRRGIESYVDWKGGKRDMVVFDERPSAFWGQGELAFQDLLTLRTALEKLETTAKKKQPVIRLRSALDETSHALLTGEPRQKVQLKTVLTQNQLRYLSQLLVPDEDTAEDSIASTLASLYSLGQRHGVLVQQRDSKQIIVARRTPLPAVPTLILDATGAFDPSYPSEMQLLDLPPWQQLQPEGDSTACVLPRIHLTTWNCTLTKSTPEEDPRWQSIGEEITDVLAKYPGDTVYVIGAKTHEAKIQRELKARLGENEEEYNRLRFNHYGNTKGSNDMLQDAAIVFTSVQFKNETYYRGIALATEKDGVSAPAKVRSRTVRQFDNQDLEEIRLRDTVVTLLQEIGRTRIRNHDHPQSITVVLPWADEQGILALQQQLRVQFRAEVTREVKQVRPKPSDFEQLLTALPPGQTLSREEVALRLDKDLKTLRSWLYTVNDELWGSEVEVTAGSMSRPFPTETEQQLAAAWQLVRQQEGTLSSTLPLVQEAA